MRIINKDFKRGVKLIVTDNEDLWLLRKIIQKGDIVGSNSSRLIKINDKEGVRKKFYIELRVNKVEFSSTLNLRVMGVIINEISDVPKGVHHSLTISVGTELIIKKEWDYLSKNYLMKAEQQSIKALIVIINSSQADFLLLSNNVKELFTINASLPPKDLPGYDNAYNSFLDEVAKSIKEKVNNKPVIIAGPAFYPDELIKRLKGLRVIKAHCYHQGIVGAKELINNGVINELLKNNEVIIETRLVNEFLKRVNKDSKVCYGFSDVQRAVNEGRVSDLLISESLIKSFREGKRFKELETLINTAESIKSRVEFISELHEAGKQFKKFGIGALLRY